MEGLINSSNTSLSINANNQISPSFILDGNLGSEEQSFNKKDYSKARDLLAVEGAMRLAFTECFVGMIFTSSSLEVRGYLSEIALKLCKVLGRVCITINKPSEFNSTGSNQLLSLLVGKLQSKVPAVLVVRDLGCATSELVDLLSKLVLHADSLCRVQPLLIGKQNSRSILEPSTMDGLRNKIAIRHDL